RSRLPFVRASRYRPGASVTWKRPRPSVVVLATTRFAARTRMPVFRSTRWPGAGPPIIHRVPAIAPWRSPLACVAFAVDPRDAGALRTAITDRIRPARRCMVLRHPGRRGGSRGRSAPPSGALWVAPGVGGLVVGGLGGVRCRWGVTTIGVPRHRPVTGRDPRVTSGRAEWRRVQRFPPDALQGAWPFHQAAGVRDLC